MSKNSLRKSRKFNSTEVDKVSKNMHWVAGKHEHNVNYSHSPISASEIEKLCEINPSYADKLIAIIETGLENDKKDRESFYAAVDKEQDNDRLAIQGEISAKKISMLVAGGIVFGFLISAMIFAFLKQYEIAGGIITIGLVGVLTAIFTNNGNKTKK